MISQVEYLQLVARVNELRPLYTEGKDTGVSNEVYDQYMADIYEYEKEHEPAPDSPTRMVNTDLGDGDVVHPIPMLSLKDVFTVDDALEFYRKHCGKSDIVVEHKLDGLSVQLIYRDGNLVSASTRGNGQVGVECLDAARYIDDIPKTIKATGEVIVHGEVFMAHSSFEDYCKRYGKQANERNTAVGIFKRKNEKERARYLSFRAFNLDNAESVAVIRNRGSVHQTHRTCLGTLADLGIPVVKMQLAVDAESINAYIDQIIATRSDLFEPIDGLVLKVDNLAYRKMLGDNGVVPNWAIAYKFPAQERETTLRGVEWQVGATGKLNPVAILDPVPVMGSTITKATLHHWQRIQELDLQLNDKVVVYKAGDIIPAIKSARHTFESVPLEKPTVCPACGEPLTESAGVGVCVNIQCREKLLARLNTWADKKVGNFKGVAGSIITGLFDRNKLRTPADFYKVKPFDILTLPSSGQAKLKTYMTRVAESKQNMTFAQILVGLGINSLAQAGAKEMEAYLRKVIPGRNFKEALEYFAALPASALMAVLGNAKGAGVYNQLQEPFIQEVIRDIGDVFTMRTL